jgi:hypothetical protein
MPGESIMLALTANPTRLQAPGTLSKTYLERIAEYFAPRFPEAATLGNEMMKTILEKTTSNN